MIRKKIALIGAGNIGGTLAHLALIRKLGDIVLIDVIKSIAKAKALDLLHASSIYGIDLKIIGTDNYKELKNSDIVIVTAGSSRKPGMSRDDLLNVNIKIIQSVGKEIKYNCPNAFVICITNPLDIIVNMLQKFSQIPDHKIVGMAGVLDSARFTIYLSEELNISVKKIKTYVIGGHGDTMVPLIKMSNIKGISLENLINKGKIKQKSLNYIISKTKNSGTEIVNLLKTGSAYYAPAAAAIQMAESYLKDKKMILSCTSKIERGMYGFNENIFIGVPTEISANGVKPIEVDISNDEKDQFKISINTIKHINKKANKFYKNILKNNSIKYCNID